MKADANTTTGLIASYNFAEVTDTIVADDSPNGLDGVMQSMDGNSDLVTGTNNRIACEQQMSQTATVTVLPELTGTIPKPYVMEIVL